MSRLHSAPSRRTAVRRKHIPDVNGRAQLLSPHTVITERGSTVYESAWDFRDDHADGGIALWNTDVVASEMKIGELCDPAFADLLRPLQEAVAIRWKYRRREDGGAWRGKRAAEAVREARTFATWAAAKGISSVTQVTEPVFQTWLKHIERTGKGAERTLRDRRRLAEIVLLMWRLRGRVSATLGFKPFSTDPADWITEGPKGEPVPLIPKPVLDHVVGSAIRFIEVYARDVRAARAYVDDLVRQWELKNGRPAPAWAPSSKEHGRFDSWLSRRFGTRSPKARKAMGPPAPWNPDGLFLRDPDTGRPWLDGIRTRHHLQRLENSLRTASYIVIAFMTGGRNTEVNQLKPTCARTIKHSNGRPDWHFIEGFVTKHRGRDPELVTWGVPEIAMKAAGLLLEILAPWRAKKNSDRLFVTQTGAKMTDVLMNTDLKVFIERVGAPYVNGKPFPISTHMLRVALAQWLAQEPYGEIAGAIHLKQLSTAAFRGYLRQDPQFQSVYESFVVQGHADHLEMVLNEPVILGKKGAEILRARTPEEQARLETQVRSINFAQVGREAPSPRTVKKLKKSGRPVYKTKLTMCFFKADSAECLKGRPTTERTGPLTHRCEPLICANSAIIRLQAPTYLEDFEEYATLADDSSQSPSQVKLYRTEMAKLAALIAPFIPTLVAECEMLERELDGADPREAATVALQQRKREIEDLLCRIEAGKVKEMIHAG
jgi:hypothetical protein